MNEYYINWFIPNVWTCKESWKLSYGISSPLMFLNHLTTTDISQMIYSMPFKISYASFYCHSIENKCSKREQIINVMQQKWGNRVWTAFPMWGYTMTAHTFNIHVPGCYLKTWLNSPDIHNPITDHWWTSSGEENSSYHVDDRLCYSKIKVAWHHQWTPCTEACRQLTYSNEVTTKMKPGWNYSFDSDDDWNHIVYINYTSCTNVFVK